MTIIGTMTGLEILTVIFGTIAALTMGYSFVFMLECLKEREQLARQRRRRR